MSVHQTFNVGVSPAQLAITANGKFAYVANSNNYSIPGSDSVTVLNLETTVPELTIHDESFVEPYRIAIDGEKAYVCNSGSPAKKGEEGTISIIDLRTNKVEGVIKGFDGPGAIVIASSGPPERGSARRASGGFGGAALAYVTNYGAFGGVQSGNGRAISVVDLKTRKIVDTITVDLAPAALALSPKQHFLYSVNYVDGKRGTGTLNVIETGLALGGRSKVVGSIPGLFGPFGIVLSPCACKAYVTNFGSNDFAPYGTTVAVVDLRKHRVVKEIEVGIQPAGIVSDGKYLFVSNYNTLYAKSGFQALTPGTGTISIIRLRDERVIAPTIAVKPSPSTLTLSPDGRRLYTCQYTQNSVTAVLLQAGGRD